MNWIVRHDFPTPVRVFTTRANEEEKPELTTTTDDNELVFSQELSLCQIISYGATLCGEDSRMLTLDIVESSNAAKIVIRRRMGQRRREKWSRGRWTPARKTRFL